MRREDKGNILAICAVALCVMITLGLCLMLSGQGFVGAMLFEGVEKESVYLVCAGPYDDLALAKNSAELIKSRGGAGYLLGSGEYELVYAAYPDLSGAQSVAQALGGAYVKTLNIKKSKLKWAKGDERDATIAALKYYRIAFDALYSCANELNAEEATIDNVKVKIGVLREQIADIKSVFGQNSTDEDDQKIMNVKLALLTALAIVDNITFDGGEAKTLSSLRYAAVQLSLSRQALMDSI